MRTPSASHDRGVETPAAILCAEAIADDDEWLAALVMGTNALINELPAHRVPDFGPRSALSRRPSERSRGRSPGARMPGTCETAAGESYEQAGWVAGLSHVYGLVGSAHRVAPC